MQKTSWEIMGFDMVKFSSKARGLVRFQPLYNKLLCSKRRNLEKRRIQ